MKIELPKNWKEIAGLKDVTYQRPPLTDSKLAPGMKPIPAAPTPALKPL
jgi:hypothetical protein